MAQQPVFRQADFYSTLDTTRFDVKSVSLAQLAQNTVNAAGTVMLGLLVGNTRPVLTQSQAFDNAYLLKLLSDNGEDALGFLNLVRRNVVQVRFHRPSLLEAPNRFTLTNAFASALMRNENFILSGWPEINADYPLRIELANCLTGRQATDPSLIRDVDGLVDPAVSSRIKGLLNFDKAIQGAGKPTLTVPTAQNRYRDLVVRLMYALRSRRMDADDLVQWLLSHVQKEGSASAAGAAETEATSQGGLDLNTRSAWTHLLDIYGKRHPEASEAVAHARSQVHFAHSKVLSESLLSTGGEVDIPTLDDALVAADGLQGDEVPVQKLIALSRDPSRNNWITWASLPALWEELRDLPAPNDRLDVLLRRHKEQVFVSNLGGRKLTTIAVAGSLPTAVVAMSGDSVQNLISGSSPGAITAILAAFTGAAVAIGAEWLISQSDSRLRPLLKERSDMRWESSVSEGTASWQDEIGGPVG
ncbi:hypothetical protein [Micromonospora sp. NPDC005189]|uniref:hypothetical protein n=1 Tax=unclassified Micromonospora TaxID=2617518 RepID=UPI0033AB118F